MTSFIEDKEERKSPLFMGFRGNRILTEQNPSDQFCDTGEIVRGR
jgi:hypothetical protein